jgi:glycosyltransferase involved in cell wall biosynthesis
VLSVILPAHNEGENIEAAVERALEALDESGQGGEVIVIDDGSTDGTREVAFQLVERHHPRVRLLRHPRNLGYGAALRTGFRKAHGEFLFYTDADNQFDPRELRWFLPFLDENDVVVGFRVYRYDTVKRSIISWLYNQLVRVLFRVRVRDVDCSFKLFRREVLDKITIECADFFVDTELVAKARKWNFRIAEKGVRHYPRTAGETTVRPSDIPRTVRTLARMWQRIYLPTHHQLDEDSAAPASHPDAVEALPTGSPARE